MWRRTIEVCGGLGATHVSYWEPCFVIRSLKFLNLPNGLTHMTVILALQNWVQLVQFEPDVQIEILGPVAQHGNRPE